MKELMEQLADIEHQRWADWQKYMHSQCIRTDSGPDAPHVIPMALWKQWERQIATDYADLSESEKESDRDQVKRYWHLIEDMQIEAKCNRCDQYHGKEPCADVGDMQAVVTAANLLAIELKGWNEHEMAEIAGWTNTHVLQEKHKSLLDTLAKLDQKSKCLLSLTNLAN